MASFKFISLLTTRALDSLPLPLLVIIFVACLILLHYPASPTPSLLPLYTPPPSLSSSPSLFEKGTRLSSFFFSFPPSYSGPSHYHSRGKIDHPFSFPRSLPAGSPSFPHTSPPASSSSSQLSYSHSRLPLVFSFPLGEKTTPSWININAGAGQYGQHAQLETTKPNATRGKKRHGGYGGQGRRKRGSKSLALKEWKLELGVVCEEAEAEADDVNDAEDDVDVEVKAGGGFPMETERRVIEV
ncbi:hypothetical protein I314_01316 [Cryptococcus bacillisporus CA1873]|uniref:Uncharacterized protein n=1 Tax=Cryptococcus bacillisporus CA1873 TaxID=1296111 RepID=A0ABR5BIJ6_CRYGA|nr:hypothetical protein I314_01316 [Cryptococcus bacillisporus CA1873]|eukprot:KIR68887.1 hypothetical protein I314_01316 [Cryptococcus gattii CA1873]